jgi:hypothetical protein
MVCFSSIPAAMLSHNRGLASGRVLRVPIVAVLLDNSGLSIDRVAFFGEQQ